MRLVSYSRFAVLALGGVVVLGGVLGGCAVEKKPKAIEAGNVGPQRVGTIALVNEELNFVLVDVGSLYTPPVGASLESYSGGVETGALTVDAQKQRPFIVADIIKGMPRVGDEVRQ